MAAAASAGESVNRYRSCPEVATVQVDRLLVPFPLEAQVDAGLIECLEKR